jgi:hypothetical protein
VSDYSELRIITNNVPRDLLMTWELPADFPFDDFDYVDWEAVKNGDSGEESSYFTKYRGQWYDVGDTQMVYSSHMPDDHPFQKWDSYISDSFFSGVLFRIVDGNPNSVICGRYFS